MQSIFINADYHAPKRICWALANESYIPEESYWQFKQVQVQTEMIPNNDSLSTR